MLRVVVAALLLVRLSLAYDDGTCVKLYQRYELSQNFNETIAHAIHSLTISDLRKFKPEVSVNNRIPVVNPRLNDPTTTVRVLRNAPYENIGSDFHGEMMNTIDTVLSNIGQPSDEFGPNWSPIGRIIHKFHMKDLWAKLLPVYQEVKAAGKLNRDICNCLTKEKNNGIIGALEWIATHYQNTNMFTVATVGPLDQPAVKLTDSSAWNKWKGRLLHYYEKKPLTDVAKYLVCALGEF